MKQITAVEWLAEQFDNIVELYPSEYEKINNVIEQAKEMEKQQVIDAFRDGMTSSFLDGLCLPEKYYEKKLRKK